MLITKTEMENLLCNALEGGSNYWYNLPDLSMVPKENNTPLVDRIMKVIYADKNLQIPVCDIEASEQDEDNGEDVLGYISYENLKRASELLATEDYKNTLAEIKSENDDASTADIWFQLVVLGEITYG